MLTPQFTPFPILETPRLLLRRMTMDDAPAHFITRTDPEGMKYLDRDMPKDVTEIHDMVNRIDASVEKNEGINWAIELKDTGEFVGSMGYYRNDFKNHRGEIGYQLSRKYWRMGVASEAMTAILNYGFDVTGYHTIFANVNPNNEASIALLKKFGFVLEAHFKEDYHYNGKFLDSQIYSLVVTNYKRK